MRLSGFSGYLPLSSPHHLNTHTHNTARGEKTLQRLFVRCVRSRTVGVLSANPAEFIEGLNSPQKHTVNPSGGPSCTDVLNCIFSRGRAQNARLAPSFEQTFRYATESTARICGVCLNILDIIHFLSNTISAKHPDQRYRKGICKGFGEHFARL